MVVSVDEIPDGVEIVVQGTVVKLVMLKDVVMMVTVYDVDSVVEQLWHEGLDVELSGKVDVKDELQDTSGEVELKTGELEDESDDEVLDTTDDEKVELLSLDLGNVLERLDEDCVMKQEKHVGLVIVEVVDVVTVVENKDEDVSSVDELGMETEHPGIEQLVMVMTLVESEVELVLEDNSELDDENGLFGKLTERELEMLEDDDATSELDELENTELHEDIEAEEEVDGDDEISTELVDGMLLVSELDERLDLENDDEIEELVLEETLLKDDDSLELGTTEEKVSELKLELENTELAGFNVVVERLK